MLEVGGFADTGQSRTYLVLVLQTDDVDLARVSGFERLRTVPLLSAPGVVLLGVTDDHLTGGGGRVQ